MSQNINITIMYSYCFWLYMFYANKGLKLGKYIQMCYEYIKIIKNKLLKSYDPVRRHIYWIRIINPQFILIPELFCAVFILVVIDMVFTVFFWAPLERDLSYIRGFKAKFEVYIMIFFAGIQQSHFNFPLTVVL